MYVRKQNPTVGTAYATQMQTPQKHATFSPRYRQMSSETWLMRLKVTPLEGH